MNILHQIDKAFQQKFPRLYFHFIQRPRIHFRFKSEKQLAQGVVLSRSSHPSILFFTTQKCASRYVGGILGRLAAAEGMPSIDYDAYQTMVKLPKADRPFSPQGKLNIAFPPQGYLFGPIGSYRQIPKQEDFKILLQLRDPRDVLTSLYFSTAFSHALINKNMLRRRQTALEQDIDSYVLDNADLYQRIYQNYADKLLPQKNVLFLKYADMVSNFDGWLSQTARFTQLANHEHELSALRSEADFSTRNEDKFSQKRQVTPGDHRRKLQKNTINKLNEIFGDLLITYKFE